MDSSKELKQQEVQQEDKGTTENQVSKYPEVSDLMARIGKAINEVEKVKSLFENNL